MTIINNLNSKINKVLSFGEFVENHSDVFLTPVDDDEVKIRFKIESTGALTSKVLVGTKVEINDELYNFLSYILKEEALKKSLDLKYFDLETLTISFRKEHAHWLCISPLSDLKRRNKHDLNYHIISCLNEKRELSLIKDIPEQFKDLKDSVLDETITRWLVEVIKLSHNDEYGGWNPYSFSFDVCLNAD